MISRLVSKFNLYRRVGALALLSVATLSYGCGSAEMTSASNPADAELAGKTPEDVLKPEQMYRYEGEGAAKRKVELSRSELERSSCAKQSRSRTDSSLFHALLVPVISSFRRLTIDLRSVDQRLRDRTAQTPISPLNVWSCCFRTGSAELIVRAPFSDSSSLALSFFSLEVAEMCKDSSSGAARRGFHVDRVARRDRHHCRIDRALASRRPGGAGGRSTHSMHKQHEANRPSAAELRERQPDLSHRQMLQRLYWERGRAESECMQRLLVAPCSAAELLRANLCVQRHQL